VNITTGFALRLPPSEPAELPAESVLETLESCKGKTNR
jgi:hypothetical protein